MHFDRSTFFRPGFFVFYCCKVVLREGPGGRGGGGLDIWTLKREAGWLAGKLAGSRVKVNPRRESSFLYQIEITLLFSKEYSQIGGAQ